MPLKFWTLPMTIKKVWKNCFWWATFWAPAILHSSCVEVLTESRRGEDSEYPIYSLQVLQLSMLAGKKFQKCWEIILFYTSRTFLFTSNMGHNCYKYLYKWHLKNSSIVPITLCFANWILLFMKMLTQAHNCFSSKIQFLLITI